MNRILRRFKRNVETQVTGNPLKVIAAGFAIVILIGTFLLTLPISAKTRHTVGPADALFTATSAVCVTGLVVRDTVNTYSLFGQVVILCLIQVGGLGFMTIATILYRMLGMQMTLRERQVVQESFNEEGPKRLKHLLRWVLLFTLTVELIGMLLLFPRFSARFGIARGTFYAMFHSISAFCNAGFDLFGNGRSLTGFRSDAYVNFVIMGLVVVGGLGFAVEQDLYLRWRRGRRHRLALQTKVVLVSYFALMALCFVFNAAAEWNNPVTLGDLPVWEKLLAALFQSVTLRTAGFNTISQAGLLPATKLVNCFFMLVGAAPASTGGGIKVTTVALIAMLVSSVAHGRDRIIVDHRTVDRTLVQRAVVIVTLALGIALADIICISLLQPDMDIMDIAYECFSAIGTVGISAAGTANLGRVGRALIIVTMYAGRIGPVSLAQVLARRQVGGEPKVEYPADRFMIG